MFINMALSSLSVTEDSYLIQSFFCRGLQESPRLEGIAVDVHSDEGAVRRCVKLVFRDVFTSLCCLADGGGATTEVLAVGQTDPSVRASRR